MTYLVEPGAYELDATVSYFAATCIIGLTGNRADVIIRASANWKTQFCMINFIVSSGLRDVTLDGGNTTCHSDVFNIGLNTHNVDFIYGSTPYPGFGGGSLYLSAQSVATLSAVLSHTRFMFNKNDPGFGAGGGAIYL
jgi:hypothetical protein